MILKSLKVLRFGGLNPGAIIDRFSDGITLIQGPNEAGKSTLLRGLTYVLYQRHSLTGETATAEIMPAGASVGPKVELVFENSSGTWRITKQFLKNKSSELAELRGGAFRPVAEGDQADERLKEMLGSAFAGRGPAGISLRGIGEVLVVDQGRLRFGGSLGDQAHESLRSVIQEVGTTQAAHGLIDRLRKRYAATYTSSGDLKKGAQAPRVVQMQAEFEGIRKQLDELHSREQEVQRLERDLSEEDMSPEEERRQRQDLSEDRNAARSRERDFLQMRAALDGLEGTSGALRREADDTRKRCRQLEESRRELAKAREQLTTGQEEEAALKDKKTAADGELLNAEDAARQLVREGEALNSQQTALLDAARAREVVSILSSLKPRLERYQVLDKLMIDVEEQLSSRPRPKKRQLSELRERIARLGELDQLLTALHLRVRVNAEADIRVEGPSGALNIRAGQDVRVSGIDPLVFAIPGVARFEVSGPPVPEREELERERLEVDRAIAKSTEPFGSRVVTTLEDLWQEREGLERDLKSYQQEHDGLFSTDKEYQSAREKLASQEAALLELLGRYPEWGGSPPTEAHVRTLEMAHKDAVRQFEGRRTGADNVVVTRKEILIELSDQLDAKREDLVRARGEVRALEGKIQALLGDGLSDEARAEKGEAAEKKARAQEERLQEVRAQLDALGDPSVSVQRAEDALDQFERERLTARDARTSKKATLDFLRGEGLWGRRGRLEEAQAALEPAIARELLRAEGLKLLNEVVAEERTRAVEELIKPIGDKLKRLLVAVVGPSVTPVFGDGLLPTGLKVDNRHNLDMEQLSAGTADQLAMLTRLAFGERYARQHGRHVFVLDDPLVNCDRDRRNRILDILIRATKDLQIVVLTCHPEHYIGLPTEETVTVELAEACRLASST